MVEYRLFDPADPPEWLDPEWWATREHCDHLGARTGAHVARLHAAAALAVKAAGPMPPLGRPVAQIVDLGAGDGALLELVGRRPHAWGYEIITADIDYARGVRGVEVHARNVQAAIDEKPGMEHLLLGEVVVLTEVLEHMADPHGFLAKLHARPEVRYVVVSSPHSETPDRHEWNHAWAWDRAGYRALLEQNGFAIVEHVDVEWSQVIVAKAARS